MKVVLIQRKALGDALYTLLVGLVLKRELNWQVYGLFPEFFCEAFGEYIDGCIPYRNTVSSIKEIKKIKADIILDYEATFRTYPIVLFSRVPLRYAFYKKKREKLLFFIYNKLKVFKEYGFTFGDRLELLRDFGIKPEDWKNKKSWPFLEPPKPGNYLVIAPKGKLPTKTIIPEKVIEIKKKLQKAGFTVEIAIEPSEKEYIKKLISLGESPFVGSLREFKELVSKSKGVISVESFPYHLAISLGKRALVILQAYGRWIKTELPLIQYYKPPLNCLHCYKKSCPEGTYACTVQLEVDEIVELCEDFFST